MARPRPSSDKVKVVAENRRARFDYAIDQTYEAGIALTGTEVKALRFGEGSIAESYAEVKGNEIWLVNSNIPEFSHGNRFNDPGAAVYLFQRARPREGRAGHCQRPQGP
jgi:SsrA-binding protein